MLLASMSISPQVGSRYSDMLVLLGVAIWPVALVTPLTWLIALAVYDKVALRRPHPASIWGGLVLLVGLILPLCRLRGRRRDTRSSSGLWRTPETSAA